MASVHRMIISCIAIWLVIGAHTSEESETPMEQLLKAKASGDIDTCRTAVTFLFHEVCDELPTYYAMSHLFINLTLRSVMSSPTMQIDLHKAWRHIRQTAAMKHAVPT